MTCAITLLNLVFFVFLVSTTAGASMNIPSHAKMLVWLLLVMSVLMYSLVLWILFQIAYCRSVIEKVTTLSSFVFAFLAALVVWVFKS